MVSKRRGFRVENADLAGSVETGGAGALLPSKAVFCSMRSCGEDCACMLRIFDSAARVVTSLVKGVIVDAGVMLAKVFDLEVDSLVTF